jgi:hypothetical protein
LSHKLVRKQTKRKKRARRKIPGRQIPSPSPSIATNKTPILVIGFLANQGKRTKLQEMQVERFHRALIKNLANNFYNTTNIQRFESFGLTVNQYVNSIRGLKLNLRALHRPNTAHNPNIPTYEVTQHCPIYAGCRAWGIHCGAQAQKTQLFS